MDKYFGIFIAVYFNDTDIFWLLFQKCRRFEIFKAVKQGLHLRITPWRREMP